MPEPRRTFGPVVLVGLAASGATALAGSRDAVRPVLDDGGAGGSITLTGLQLGEGLSLPVVGALGLVALAAWGVVLVTRGGVRRLVAAVAALAAAGALVAGLTGLVGLRERTAEALAAGGESGTGQPTAWFVLGVLAALLATAAGVAAVRLAPRWPEMGSRYDAPTSEQASGPASGGAGGAERPEDLWRAIGEGHDPTADPAERPLD